MFAFRVPLLLCCLSLVPVSARGDELAKKIEAVIDGPSYKQAHWGILIVDSKSGDVLYARNAERLFAPASTTKLYSCATALCVLGPDHKFETPVYARGKVNNGKLDGDLILVASGDLTMGGRTDSKGKMLFADSDHIYAAFGLTTKLVETDPLAGLVELAKQIRKSGIETVSGDVMIDDRLFQKSSGSGSGPRVLTPIIINDNVLDILVTPGEKPGSAARVESKPATRYLAMDADVRTVEKGKATHLEIQWADAGKFTVRGQIAVDSRPRIGILPVEDPAAFARTLFIEVLQREGVRVSASAFRTPEKSLPDADGYAKLDRVAQFTSPPLSEAIKVNLKVSHNLHASTLPLLVAVKNKKRTLDEGLTLQGKFLKELGVPVETISFGGGAGGANADMVTPEATVALLRAMAKRPEFSAYKTALPVLGVDGTLVEAVDKDSPARGKVFAKTGTLGWSDLMNDRSLVRSKALAGYMTTAKNRELTFAFFVNDVPLPKGEQSAAQGKVLGKICEIVHDTAP